MAATIRRRLMASTFLIGGALVASPLLAQSTNNAPSTPPAGTTDQTTGERETSDIGDTAPNEDVVVTGSRIASRALISASPLQIIDAKDIDDSGTPNLQSVLLQNPAFGTPGISRTNSNFSTSSAGVATVDLRNLGSDRTLVLVDGRRFVAGIPGSATVDLNVIPAQFIERVDVLTGGASAIYGSDAVAGVVNIIYKKNFQGVELGGQFGISEEGDSAEKQANLTVGGNFGDDRGNVIAYVGYTKEGAVFSRDRKRSAIDQASTGANVTGDPNDIFSITTPFYSGFNPRGTLGVVQGIPGFDSNGDGDFTDPGDITARGGLTRTYDPVTGALVAANTNGAGGNATGFNRSQYRTIAIPTERYLFATRANYEISKAANIFLEGTYASTSVTTEIEPFPLDSSGVNGIFPATGGRFAIENFITNPTTGATVLSRNPLVPLAVFNQALDTPTRDTNGNGVIDRLDAGGDGLRDLAFTRRLNDFGNRGSTADRDTFRIVAGIDGDITDKFKYEAYYTYGQTKESQFSGGQVNVLNFRNALDVVTDVFDLNGNGSTADAICRDANARAQGCVPADVFNGAGTLSQAAVNYIAAPSQLTSFTSQSVAGANVSGSLFDLPAGPLGISVGTEYRREAARQTFDALTNAGLNGGNRLANTEGRFDVIEGFGELRIPLLANQPFFHELTATGAGRVSKYSTVGTTFSYNGNLEWAPVEDIRFRGVYARSVRAPNIGELFGGAGQDFPTGILDPCVGVTAATAGTLGTQCRADPGVRENIGANGAFTLNQADIQGVSGLNTSNPNLDVEKGTSYTLGAVINPRSINFLRNFSFTVDYFNIKIDDAIVSVPRNFILQQCYQQANAGLCQFITRRPTAAGSNSAGSLDFVNATSNNSGGLKTSGLDVTASYRSDLASVGLPGRVNFNVAWTHVFTGYVTPLPGEPRDNFNNEVGASRNKVFGTFSYDIENVGVTFRGNYIGPAFLDDQFLTQFQDPALPENQDVATANDIYLSPTDRRGRIKSTFYLDTQVRFSAGDNYEFYVGANNVLDTAPPPVISGLPGSTTGAETDAGTYDAIGRRFYAGARIKF
ncbi:TonB-dependent receptor domain-containing protein [Sphingomonas endolithica]|uniref:TonB-dependent receptor domain-containing protein n=1 Tax=Sphingomonas endolithica TaxID=2972485 RepID=UPI0021AF10BD|nr:TonB-dependent receptor [Sphingomonas sp. ZFBP2030]